MLMADCRWPVLPEKYLTALKDAVDYILSEYKAVVGILASGTIIRGIPDPSSDLDIYVIHMDNFRQRIQRYSKGIPTEIFINPPSMIEKYLEMETEAGHPITAHMLATGVVIAQSGPILETLCNKARMLIQHPQSPPKDLTLSRYMIATLFEDALDVCKRDKASSKMILSLSIEQMLRHEIEKHGRYQPRAKELLEEIMYVDKVVGQLARQFYSARSFKRQLSFASRIADNVLKTRGFFEWKSEKEPVTE